MIFWQIISVHWCTRTLYHTAGCLLCRANKSIDLVEIHLRPAGSYVALVATCGMYTRKKAWKKWLFEKAGNLVGWNFFRFSDFVKFLKYLSPILSFFIFKIPPRQDFSCEFSAVVDCFDCTRAWFSTTNKIIQRKLLDSGWRSMYAKQCSCLAVTLCVLMMVLHNQVKMPNKQMVRLTGVDESTTIGKLKEMLSAGGG